MRLFKFIKIISINILIFLIIIFVFEIILGYWFKKNNFGIYMRSERNKAIKFSVNHHNNEKINFIHRRNFYGFIGDEFNPEDVKIIFEGGSTGAEIWKPQETSIVGVLNNLLNKNDIDKKIYNASVNGKSIRGYVYDFNHWFKRIPNFRPEYVIFYLGINDRKFPNDELHRFYDEQHSTETYIKIRDYIKNNSFILEKIKKIENKFFTKNKIQYNKNKKNLYDNYKYIDYKKALELYSTNYKQNDKEYLKIINQRLENLKQVIIEANITPIFITQIKFDGISERRLFLVNEEIKKFTKMNNYKIIPLDELILRMDKGDFFDEFHTTISGSKKIANKIYDQLEFK